MIKWTRNAKVARVALACAAIASFALAAGAGTRWY
jgi:hypothetical protein